MPELDVLRRLGDQIVAPPFEALNESARRVRRAKVATGIAGAACVAAISGMSVYLGVFAGHDTDRRDEPAPAPTPTSRPLTYADGNTVHYGDRAVEADGTVVELDVTDDGVGFRTEDGRFWFTDGSMTDSLGALGTTGPGYDDPWPLMTHPGWMLSANSGSRLVWFEFPVPGEPEVVVYDTHTRTETARETVALGQGQTAVPGLLSDRFVYWFQDPDNGLPPENQVQIRYDPATGDQTAVTEPELLADLDDEAAVRSVRIKGDGRWETDPHGLHYSDGMGLQMAVNLQQDVAGVDGVALVGPGDMVAQDVNREPFTFEPPTGYAAKSGVAWLVQWLDDNTVIVLNPLRQRTELIACHIDTTTCEVAASVPVGVVVPDFGQSEFMG